jgi:serine/threonine protein kinase
MDVGWDDADHKQAECEANVMAELSGGCKYIVGILRHGRLEGSKKLYYIDMDLCNINLHDYLYDRSALVHEASLFHEPAFVSRDSSIFVRVSNIWTIVNHISQGVAFIHGHQISHRDLKPRNGLAPAINGRLTTVVYSHSHQVWKIVDFGIATATKPNSKSAITTNAKRGTDGYRAPELFQRPKCQFTSRVDIWAIGCILFELITHHPLFEDDHAIWEIARSPPGVKLEYISELELSNAEVPETVRPHFSGCLRELLDKDAQRRPRALAVKSVFESYCILWETSFAQIIDDAKLSPSYTEWRDLISKTAGQPTPGDIIAIILNWYQLKGRDEVIKLLEIASFERFPEDVIPQKVEQDDAELALGSLTISSDLPSAYCAQNTTTNKQ